MEQVIDRLLSFGLRSPVNKKDDAKRYGSMLDEYIEAVYAERLSPEKIHDAMSSLRNTWKYNRWPTIAELLEILKPPQYVGTAEVLKKPEKTESWADEVMRLPEGQRALKEGFGRELYLWCDKNPGIVPSQAIMAECKSGDDKFRDNLKIQIERVKNASYRKGDGNLAPLANAMLLDAAGKMEGFETKLRNQFLAT